MRWGFIILTVGLVFAAAANGGQSTYFCGVREYQWNDTKRDRIIKAAAWYPTHQEPKTVSYGPLQGYARRKAAPAPGRHPLLLISHGTGGSRYNQVYLSERLAENGYIILAVQHPKNCGGAQGDNSDADRLVNLWDRPKDVSFALDQALKEVELASHIDPEKIGIIGHSLGGYTALALVGAKPDIGRLDNLCNSLRGWFAGRFCRLKKDVHPILRKKALAFFNNAFELKRSIQTSP